MRSFSDSETELDELKFVRAASFGWSFCCAGPANAESISIFAVSEDGVVFTAGVENAFINSIPPKDKASTMAAANVVAINIFM